jgi:hypothetical protein
MWVPKHTHTLVLVREVSGHKYPKLFSFLWFSGYTIATGKHTHTHTQYTQHSKVYMY